MAASTIHEVHWTLNGKSYMELRAVDKPEFAKARLESMAYRDWPIENVDVRLPPKPEKKDKKR